MPAGSRVARRRLLYGFALLISLVGLLALARPAGRNASGTAASTSASASTFTLLHAFSASAQSPVGSLVLDGLGNAYGTATLGGSHSYGAVFKMRTDGTGFTLLHSFAGAPSDGQKPNAGLVLDSSGFLYGTTVQGGSHNDLGTIFKIKTDGTGYSILHDFVGGAADGKLPYASLILDGSGFLYGTTFGDGTATGSVVFKLRTDGLGYVVLHTLAGGTTDGLGSYAALLSDGAGTLFGTTHNGGISDRGTVFTLKTDGTAFALVHSFAGGTTDGQYPQGALVRDGAGFLYGTTLNGGNSSLGLGTVFKVKTDGSGFQLLHAFTGGTDGSNPYYTTLTLESGTLYGANLFGAAPQRGVVFKMATDGTGFTTIHTFLGSPSDAGFCETGVVSDGAGNLFGTTAVGGAFNLGAVFRLKTDGTGFALLHSFADSDGSGPAAPLVQDASGFLYGTAQFGGANAVGSVFKVKTDGTGFAVLHDFSNGTDAQKPVAGLVLDGSGFLYGTTISGGTSGYGAVFKVKTDGTGYTILHSFAIGATDGKIAYGGLTLDGAGFLYGTTIDGASGMGTVFKIKTDGTGFALLHTFQGGASDGNAPYAALLLDGSGNLYGTTLFGGASDQGTIFKLTTSGSGFALLHSFAGGIGDGQAPRSPLITDGAGMLYGTTVNGGSASLGQGVVFKIKTDGTGFALLHAFAGGASDGANPFYSGLALGAGSVLYGTTFNGGSASQGTAFQVKTDATGFAVLHSFTGGASDGAFPYAGVVVDNLRNLYGTTAIGGFGNDGTVYKIAVTAPPPQTPTPTPTTTFTPAPSRTPTPVGTPAAGLGYFRVAPCRLVDTRNPNGPLGGPALTAGADRTFTLAGSCGVPASALALAVNVSVTQPTAGGNLTLFAPGTANPGTAAINYRAGQTRANNAVIAVDASGAITVHCSQSSGSVQLVLDVNGYFQ